MNSFMDEVLPPDEAPSGRIWSDYQQEVFKKTEESDANLIIQAVAGSGKTTTIVEAMSHTDYDALFLAFNKSIQLDIQDRLQSGSAKTLNALGYRQFRNNHPKVLMNADKIKHTIADLLGDDSYIRRDYGFTIQRTIGLAKNNAFGIEDNPEPNAAEFEQLIDSYQFDVPVEELPNVAEVCAKVFELSLKNKDMIDFDDQLYVPARMGWEYPNHSTVFVDEAQDLSPIQHIMLDRMRKQGSRIIAVGDRYQAIYGFRGAMSNSMDALKLKFDMTELPLSISYRCATSIIERAKAICPHIEARPGAPEGLVLNRNNDYGDPLTWDSGLIICRNNAPLFQCIMAHVRAKKPCRVLSNFLDSFEGFFRSFKVRDTKSFLRKLDLWYAKEFEAARTKRFRGKMLALTDKYDTAKFLAEGYSTVEEIIQLLKQLKTSSFGPTFSTIHKAKGLEAEEVYLLRPELIGFMAESPEQKQQEENLRYVAITRAKNQLTFGVEKL